MKIYTIDDLFKGRGPDKQKRKRKGIGERSEAEQVEFAGNFMKEHPTSEGYHESQVGTKYKDFIGRTTTVGNAEHDIRNSKLYWEHVKKFHESHLSKSLIDDSAKGRGLDKQPRKKRGSQSILYEGAARSKESDKYYSLAQKARKAGNKEEFEKYTKKAWDVVEENRYKKSMTELVDKRPDLQKALEGPVKWVGKAGFDECVAHLSGKKGITNARALCGYLKEEARNRGTLKPSHMGKIEKKEYLKNRKKGKK
jgi:hypothetical protein